MLDFLSGTVVERAEDEVVIGLGGVGIRLVTPARTAERLEPGSEARFFTHLLVRDEALEVYGFATREEREMFLVLLSVPQVGPRLAFRLVSALPPAELAAAVRRGDLSLLDGVKGVGRRTAQRVLLELSEKVGEWAPPETPSLGEKEQIVLQALTSKTLGFSEAEARRVLERVRAESPEAPVEEMLRRALSLLARS